MDHVRRTAPPNVNEQWVGLRSFSVWPDALFFAVVMNALGWRIHAKPVKQHRCQQ